MATLRSCVSLADGIPATRSRLCIALRDPEQLMLGRLAVRELAANCHRWHRIAVEPTPETGVNRWTETIIRNALMYYLG